MFLVGLILVLIIVLVAYMPTPSSTSNIDESLLVPRNEIIRMKNLNTRKKILLSAVLTVVAIVVVMLLAFNGIVDLPLQGTAVLVHVNPNPVCIPLDVTQTFTFTGSTIQDTTWSTLDSAIAIVPARAQATGKSAGNTKLIVQRELQTLVSVDVQVAAICPENPIIPVWHTVELTSGLMDGQTLWVSSTPAIAQVDQTGMVTGLKPGQTWISRNYRNGKPGFKTLVTVR
jgi:hypothetical protein